MRRAAVAEYARVRVHVALVHGVVAFGLDERAVNVCESLSERGSCLGMRVLRTRAYGFGDGREPWA